MLSARGGELEQDFGYGVVRQLLRGAAGGDEPAQRRSAAERGGRVRRAGAVDRRATVPATAPASPGAVLHGLYWLTANLCCRPAAASSRSTTRIGPTARRSPSCTISRAASRGWRCSSSTRRASGEGASDALPAFADAGFAAACCAPACSASRRRSSSIERSLGQRELPRSSPRRAASRRPATRSCCRSCCARCTPTASRPTHGELRARRADRARHDQPRDPRPAAAAGAAATQLAFAIAVLGRSAELRHAAALAALDPDAAGAAADALTSAAILRDRRPLEFIHPIVRTTIYAEIPAAQRAASHKRAARLLEQRRRRRRRAWRRTSWRASRRATARSCGWLRAAAAEVSRARRARGRVHVPATRARRATAERRSAPASSTSWARRSCRWGDPEAHRTPARGARKASTSHARAARPRRRASSSPFALHGRSEEGLAVLDASIDRLAEMGMSRWRCSSRGCSCAPPQLDPHDGAARAGAAGALRGAPARRHDRRADAAGRRSPSTPRTAPSRRRARPSWPSSRSPAAACSTTSTARARRELPARDMGARLRRPAGARRGAVHAGRRVRPCARIADRLRDRVRLPAARCASARDTIAEAEAEARNCLEAAGHAWIIGRPMMIGCVLDAMVERADGRPVARFSPSRASTRTSLARRWPAGCSTAAATCAWPRAIRPARCATSSRSARATALGHGDAAVPTRASAALAHAQLGEHERARELAAESSRCARVWGTPGRCRSPCARRGSSSAAARGWSCCARPRRPSRTRRRATNAPCR